jgi:predicted molibdopterin-dependent oxidoreductase YjgC
MSLLPGSLREDEGTVTNAEGRVIRIRQAVQPPGKARLDYCVTWRDVWLLEAFPLPASRIFS